VYPDAPIILLSNASFESIQRAAARLTSQLESCILLKKFETLPDALVDVIDRYFREFRLEPQRKNILKRLFGSLLLQPNISGVGIDLKKLSGEE
jgi:hypothetical protein